VGSAIVLLLAAAVALAFSGPGGGGHAVAKARAKKKCKKGHERIRGKCRPKPLKISRFGAMFTDTASNQARLDRLRALGTNRVRLVARLERSRIPG
jgi:hypothetical protein